MQHRHSSTLHPQLFWTLTNISDATTVPLQGPQQWHPQRRLGHTASLLALSALSETKLEDLQERHYYKLSHKELLISRSHTQNLAAACALPMPLSPDGVLSIGIDLESIERQIKPEIAKFYLHTDDQVSDQLSNWCAKEAAFKALSSYLLFQEIALDKPLTLKDFVVQDGHFRCATSVPFKALGRIEWIFERDHLICLAVLDQYSL